MIEDIVILTLLLVPAIVAWSVPALRKMNGSWLIALKTVPVGMVTLCLAIKLLSEYHKWLCEYRLENVEEINYFVKPAIVLGITMISITISGHLVHKIMRTGKKFNPLPSFLLLFPALAAFSIMCIFVSLYHAVNVKNHQADWKSIYLPRQNGDGLVFEQQSIHPFLAEYNYRIRFVRNRKSTCQWLFVNYGGSTHFNIYRLKDGRLLFRDKDWDYIVDTANRKVFRLGTLDDKLYAAEIPNENVNSWGGPYRKNDSIVMDMGNHTVTAEDVSGITDQMTYFGCITNKFYPAAQRAEEDVNKRW